LLPIIYLLVERHLRGRAWAELGLRRDTFRAALRENWLLILLVSVVIQAATVMVALFFWPALLEHIRLRVPLLDAGHIVPLLLLLPLATLGEELVYRGLFQQRLGRSIGTLPSLLVVSLLFTLLHYSAGDRAVVTMDLMLVFVDSVIYGAIYARSQNLWATWLAHWLADLVALGLMVLLIAA
jgi:membrane protease YdiL (CAAX protease family)